jgi:hypothetical protein
MSKRTFYVELSIPNTTKSMGFYLDGTSREDVEPDNPFILEDGAEYDYSVKVLGIDETE